MKQNIKKIILWLLSLGVFLFVINLTVFFGFGDVNYKESISTSLKTDKNQELILTTNWADLKVDRKWSHIVMNPTCPGYVGSFASWKGIINYEYGMNSHGYLIGTINNSASVDDTIQFNKVPFKSDYLIEIDTINGLELQLVEGKGTFGIYVPAQNDMLWGLTIYPSIFGYNHKDEVIKLVSTAIYKTI